MGKIISKQNYPFLGLALELIDFCLANNTNLCHAIDKSLLEELEYYFDIL